MSVFKFLLDLGFELKGLPLQFLLIVALLTGGVATFFPRSADLGGFVFGIGLFSFNMFLLAIFAGRLLSKHQPTDKKGLMSSPFIAVLMLIKMILLGFGAYVAVVLLKLSPWFFVAGAFASVMVLALLATWRSAGGAGTPV